jgi:DNA-binding Lrp family transcriptional regulator
MRELSVLEKKIIFAISRGIEITARPFEKIAREVSVGEETVIGTLETLVNEKKIRRLCAVLRHRRLGYAANAMCVFDVSDENIDAAGEYAASFPEVSHCYRRARAESWPYNLYAMVHSHTEAECAAVADKIASRSAAADYKLLYSVKELKKENMIYFDETGSPAADKDGSRE